ncbi:MAG TPA: ATP-binding protein [Candidatus Limnocylindria bacterium]
MKSAAELDTLLAVPLVALLPEPRTAETVSAAASEDGLSLSPQRAERLLDRLVELGLARPVAARGERAYVATSLGQRMAASLAGTKPQLADALAELERLRSDLLATIGHEMRTPLTSIRTSVGLLLDPGLAPSEEQRQQLLTTIARSADRMQRLVGDLLDYSRLRAGGVELTRVPMDAREVAREVSLAIEPLVTAREQTFRVDLPPGPVRLTGDRPRLEQALLNLVSNAQKFTPSGAEFALRLTADEQVVRWAVEDRGPGISAEERTRLFERFFVGAGDRGGRSRGIGLGLPTALAIAQAHGGDIEVDSQVGRGSTFTLVIPRGGA